MEMCKKILKMLRPALIVTLTLMVICGLGYPLLMNGLAGTLFPRQAGGNLVLVDGEPIGSEFVGQEFTQDYFMKGRPSAVHYNIYSIVDGAQKYSDGTAFTGVASGSSNYGASDPALVQRVQADIDRFLADNPDVAREDIPTDLMTASGSGLDPHISPRSAVIQIPAISAASGLSTQMLEEIVANNTTRKLFGVFGEETVNVLGVNVDIARAMGLIS